MKRSDRHDIRGLHLPAHRCCELLAGEICVVTPTSPSALERHVGVRYLANGGRRPILGSAVRRTVCGQLLEGRFDGAGLLDEPALDGGLQVE